MGSTKRTENKEEAKRARLAALEDMARNEISGTTFLVLDDRKIEMYVKNVPVLVVDPETESITYYEDRFMDYAETLAKTFSAKGVGDYVLV